MNAAASNTQFRKDRIFPATAMPDADWWQTLWPDPRAVMKALGIDAGMTVVDLCCGDGYFTSAIAKLVGSGRVIAVDLDPAMLQQAKAACSQSLNCEWVLGDVPCWDSRAGLAPKCACRPSRWPSSSNLPASNCRTLSSYPPITMGRFSAYGLASRDTTLTPPEAAGRHEPKPQLLR